MIRNGLQSFFWSTAVFDQPLDPAAFVRTHRLPTITGLSMQVIRRLSRNGKFPRIVKFSDDSRASGVMAAELTAYLAARAIGQKWTAPGRIGRVDTPSY